jgi:pimeloyl-ACP methyl ester carboxylesterase
MNEPLVMIAGPTMDARIFLPQMLAVSGVCPAVLPGRLRTGSVEAMADDALEAAPGRVTLMGHGVGAMAAIEALRRAPYRIARLVLVATDPLLDSATVSSAREAQLVQARAGRLGDVLDDDPAVRDYRARPGCEDLAEALVDMGLTAGADGFEAHVRCLQRRPDQQRTLRQARVPVLVIGGTADPIQPARRQEFIAGLVRGARLELVEGAGHLVTLEAPDRVNDALVGFLTEPAASAARVS